MFRIIIASACKGYDIDIAQERKKLTMSKRPNIFEDMSRIAGDAATAFSSMKEDVEAMAKQRLDRMLSECDLVRREEFEVVRAMAQAAREEQEQMKQTIATLEARLQALETSAESREPEAS